MSTRLAPLDPPIFDVVPARRFNGVTVVRDPGFECPELLQGSVSGFFVAKSLAEVTENTAVVARVITKLCDPSAALRIDLAESEALALA